MNTKKLAVGLAAAVALAIFAIGATIYQPEAPSIAKAPVESTLVRLHSPMIGPENAPVTLVEFFDPSCEACRAMYPHVKAILAKFPEEVRLVLRYAAFHEGSDQAVRMLEAAKLQGKFAPALEALLRDQPVWAAHGAPDLEKAWQSLAGAGVDLALAKADATKAEISLVLQTDATDILTHKVERTPTFFVNGKPLLEFGPDQLMQLVASEVELAKGSDTAID